MEMQRIFVAGCLLALSGGLQAATCPTAEEITQKEGQNGGYEYEAAAGNGQKWSGEDPSANEQALSKVKFVSAHIDNMKKHVLCDYEGGGEGIRLALETDSPLTPLGPGWDAIQHDGNAVQECKQTDPAKCEFQ